MPIQEKSHSAPKNETKSTNIYELKKWEWLFRAFLNLWIKYSSLSESERYGIETKFKSRGGLKVWDSFHLTNKWDVIVTRKNNKDSETFTIFESHSQIKAKITEWMKEISPDIQKRLDKERIIARLSKEKIPQEKIKHILESFSESWIKYLKIDELKFSNHVFYVLRDWKPIFYEATSKIPTTFWPNNEWLVQENIFKESEWISELEKELEKMVDIRIWDYVLPVKKEEKEQYKKELVEDFKKAKEVIKSAKIQKRDDFISKYCSLVWLKTLSTSDVRSIWFFESYFNDNVVSSWHAKWRLQVTWIAESQVLKINPKIKKWNLKNPVYNSLIAISYLKWIEKFFVSDKAHVSDAKNAISDIRSHKSSISSKVSEYLKNKGIQMWKPQFDMMVSKISNDPYYFNKFLVIRKYNADTSRKKWEVIEHRNYYALVVLYLSEFAKSQVADAEKQASKKIT